MQTLPTCVNDAGQWLLEWGGAWRLFVLALDKPGMKVVTIKKYQFGCIGAAMEFRALSGS